MGAARPLRGRNRVSASMGPEYGEAPLCGHKNPLYELIGKAALPSQARIVGLGSSRLQKSEC